MWKKIDWKRTIALLLCMLLMTPVSTGASEYWPEPPETVSAGVVLMEASTGAVLYAKNDTEIHYPASITKIMTVLVTLENSSLDEIVTFSDRAIDETTGSGIARDYGEQMTMEQCLYAIMLESANECAFAVAEHVGGTMEQFAEMMNAKAKELGCVNTHFANPHGLHDENHYTCAHDMALIAREAYENETFRILTGTKIYTIPPTNKHPDEDTVLRNHHDMLVTYRSANRKYLYEYCVGGKTGYTEAANNTLVTYAEKDGMTLICVVMYAQSPGQYEDTTSLFHYGFDNFQLMNVAENDTKYNNSSDLTTGILNQNQPFVDIDQTAAVVIPKTAEFVDVTSEITYENISENVVGTIAYTYAGRDVGSADIIKTGVVIEAFPFENQNSDQETETEQEEKEISIIQVKPRTIILIVFGILLIAIIVLLGKKLYDNYYIIRHNFTVWKSRKSEFSPKRKHKKRRKRHKY